MVSLMALRAYLTDANLAGAILYDANLVGAILYDANLAGADLTRADLMGAIVNSANLTEVILYGANLNNIIQWQDIINIELANIYKVQNPPKGFMVWAQEHGAVSIEDNEEWKKLLHEKMQEKEKEKQ